MGKRPMINHIMEPLLKAGIRDIMMVTSPDHMDHIVRLLGSGAEFGCDITYKIQDKANGIAAALGLCEDFARGSKLAVILGDNIFEDTDEPAKAMRSFFDSSDDYHLFLKSVPNPQRFGVPRILDGKIIDIVEKPERPSCDLAVTGLYMYTDEVFEVIKTLKPSPRGEYEISDVNSFFVRDRKGSYTSIACEWIDAGTFDSYLKANIMVSK